MNLFKINVCYFALKTVKISDFDDDLDEIMNLESGDDSTSPVQPSIKAEPEPSSWPGPMPNTRNVDSLVVATYCNATYRFSIKLKLQDKQKRNIFAEYRTRPSCELFTAINMEINSKNILTLLNGAQCFLHQTHNSQTAKKVFIFSIKSLFARASKAKGKCQIKQSHG